MVRHPADWGIHSIRRHSALDCRSECPKLASILFGENDAPNRRTDLLDPSDPRPLGRLSDGTRRWYPFALSLESESLIAGNPAVTGTSRASFSAGGAIVTGVEAATEMLALATRLESKTQPAISYHLGSVSSMEFLADGVFDAVITNNVIQDVEKFQDAFREFNRVLRLDGEYIHVENHPCFSLSGAGWVRDAQGNRLYRKVDYYFNREPFLSQWRSDSGMEPAVTWHRTLGDIMNSLISVGFQITRVIEPEPPEFWRDNERQNDAFRIPEFLALVCKKLGNQISTGS